MSKCFGKNGLRAGLTAMVEETARRIAAANEAMLLDAAIALAADDGEHGVSRPRQLELVNRAYWDPRKLPTVGARIIP